MNDPTTGDSELPSKPAPAPVAAAVPSLDLEQLVPGGVWQGRYRVGEVLPDITYGKMLRARAVDTDREVILRSYRVTDDGRARACARMRQVHSAAIAGPIETQEQEGRRIEISEAIDAPTLRDWSQGRKLSLPEIRTFVAQLVPLLAGLHEAGVAHLNLKPEVIFVKGSPESPTFILGGLESATDFTQSCLVSITVEPFYAPPEAIGLYQHHCSPALRAWDWWSFGRIVQELVLGQHVLGVFLNRDVSRHTPELLIRADQFLREKQGAASRAGGVEVMPAMEPALNTLLRGLLSGCRDARWGRPDLEAWLRGEAVKERYNLGQQERLFVWKDRGYSVAEAAEFFSEEANWSDAPANVFARDDAKTLAHFLSENTEYRRLDQRLEDLARMSGSSAFVDLDSAAVREVFTGIALGTLANGALPLRLRGRRVDLAYLRQLLRPEAQPMGLSLVEALTETAAVQHVSPFDGDAGRLLQDAGHLAGSAIALAVSNRWLSRADRERLARLRLIALEPEAELDRRVAEARSRFAIARGEELTALLVKTELSPAERVVLAFVAEDPGRHKLVTHAEWAAEQYRTFHDNGERLAVLSTWLHLASALRLAPHLVGPWPVFAVFWAVLGGCVAVAFPSRLTLGLGVAFVVVGVALRLTARGLIRSGIQARLPEAGTGPIPSARSCENQAVLLLKSSLLPTRRSVEQDWAEVNEAIRGLRSPTPLALVRPASRFGGVRTLALATAVASLALLGGLGWRIVRHPPQLPALAAAWLNPAPSSPKDEPPPTAEPKKAAADDKNVETKMSWGYRPSDNPVKVHLSDTREASGAETKAAAAVGQRVTDPYKRETIDQLVAVRVPTDSGIALMLYDGRSERVADRRIFIASYEPLPRSWVVLGDRVGIYLTGQ